MFQAWITSAQRLSASSRLLQETAIDRTPETGQFLLPNLPSQRSLLISARTGRSDPSYLRALSPSSLPDQSRRVMLTGHCPRPEEARKPAPGRPLIETFSSTSSLAARLSVASLAEITGRCSQCHHAATTTPPPHHHHRTPGFASPVSRCAVALNQQIPLSGHAPQINTRFAKTPPGDCVP